MTFVQWTADANRQTDGVTARAHWELSAKRGNVEALAKITPPPFPEPLAHVWEWFAELHAARPDSMNGIAGFTYTQIDAWARMTGRDPEPWEVGTLFKLDAVYRAAMAS